MSWTQTLWIIAALGLLWVGWRLHRPPLRLHISERGILDRRLRLGWIPWDEVEGAYGPSLDDRDSLRLRLRATHRLRRRLRRLAREIAPDSTSVDVRLDLSGSDFNAVELLQFVLMHTDRRQPRQS